MGWKRQLFQTVHGLSHICSAKSTLAILSRSYVWKGMRQEFTRWAKACDTYARNKVFRHTVQPVLSLETPALKFEHLHIDVVGPLPVDQGMRYLLTMMDRTTRWPEVCPMAAATADEILQAFLSGWVAHYRVPREITSDRGAQFTLAVLKKMMAELGIEVSKTTAYHLQANGLVERFHRGLIELPPMPSFSK